TSAGAYDKAIDDLQKALLSKPGDKEISLQLARVYGLAGKLGEERKILEAFGQTQPGREQTGNPGGVVGSLKEIEAANSEDPKIAQPALEELIKKNPKNAMLWAR